MRLVCPNCDAEYEVDASVIPDGGRDVQCSNCGHAWFQNSPEAEAEFAAEEALYEPPPAPHAGIAPTPAAAAAAAVADTAGAQPASPSPPPPPPALDASILEVLREEAEREVEARRAEAPAMEVQTDMALDAPAAEAGGMGAVARRLARLKGVEPEKPAAKPATRADGFPAIEEINSTLRPSNEKRAGAASVVETTADQAKARSAFRSGFTLMVILAAIIVALYVMAPKLAEQIPSLAGVLDDYVTLVNAARAALDRLLQSAIGFLRGLAGGAS